MTAADLVAAYVFGQRFRYLRLSVTEVCNFRCTYCLPEGYRKSETVNFLSVDEAARLVSAFAGLGVGKVRLTGGEPTVRRDLTKLISRIAIQPGIDKVALTTNGWNLRRNVAEWSRAGLTHLNVSIDSLDRSVFAAITGHDRLPDVLAGLDVAQDLPLKSVKVNAVLLRDCLEQGFLAWTEFVRQRSISVRFIELMRTGDNQAFFERQHVSGSVLRDWLLARGWVPVARGADDGPAVEFHHTGYAGRIGLIAPYAPGFCDGCNRFRVNARGQLRLCLFGRGGRDLRDLLASDDQKAELQRRIVDAMQFKPSSHALHVGDAGDARNLAQTGG
jgi:GTP 3',8-cyclase